MVENIWLLRSEAVVHDGVEVVRLVAGVSVPAVPAGGVVRPCGLPTLIAQIRERRGGVHPGVDEELPSAPGLDVVWMSYNVLCVILSSYLYPSACQCTGLCRADTARA